MRASQGVEADTETFIEAHLREIIESQPVCLTRIAADGTFLAVNKAALTLLGAERLDQVLDRSILDFVIAHQREPCEKFLHRVSAGERESLEADLTCLRGVRHTLQMHAVGVSSSLDGIRSTLCTFRDVTEQRRLERALVDSEKRERAAIEGGHAAEREETASLRALVSDLEHQLNEATLREQAAQVTRSSLSGEIDQLRTIIVALERDVADAAEHERHQAERQQAEREAAHAQHREEVAHWEQILEDVTAEHTLMTQRLQETLVNASAAAAMERQVLQTQLGRADRLARSARVAVSLAMDLVNVLDRLTEASRDALNGIGSATGGRGRLEALHVAALDAHALAAQLRSEATADVSSAPLNITLLIRHLEPALHALLGPDITFVVLAASSDAEAPIGRAQFEQLILTLVADRRSVMAAGGHIALEVAEVEVDHACARERDVRTGPYVLVAVHASGGGSDANLPDGFFAAPGRESSWRGAGAGLGTVFTLTAQAHGSVWATQETDAVSFEIYLPRLIDPTTTSSVIVDEKESNGVEPTHIGGN